MLRLLSPSSRKGESVCACGPCIRRSGPFDTLLKSSLKPACTTNIELSEKSLPELWRMLLERRLNSKRVQAVFPSFKDGGETVHAQLPIPELRRLQKKLKQLVHDALPAAASTSWCQGHDPRYCIVHGDLNAANIMVDLHGNPWYIDFAVREFKMYM